MFFYATNVLLIYFIIQAFVTFYVIYQFFLYGNLQCTRLEVDLTLSVVIFDSKIYLRISRVIACHGLQVIDKFFIEFIDEYYYRDAL